MGIARRRSIYGGLGDVSRERTSILFSAFALRGCTCEGKHNRRLRSREEAPASANRGSLTRQGCG